MRHIDWLGNLSVFFPDHFSDQGDPSAALASVGASTETLRVRKLVFDVDCRHPVVYAKQMETLHIVGAGRFELGILAGWMESD